MRIAVRREKAGQGAKRGPSWRSRVTLATVTVVLAGLAAAAQARAYVYFGTGIPDAIARANLDGSGVNPSLIPGTSAPLGIAVDG